MEMADLDLMTLGKLNDEVKALIPSLVQSLPADDAKCKAKLNIVIELQRSPDSEVYLIVKHSVKPVYPRRAEALLCRQDLFGNLKTEISPLKQQVIFSMEEEKEAVNNG